MLRVPHRHHGKLTVLLLLYCFVGIYYITSFESTAPHRTREVEVHRRPPPEITIDIRNIKAKVAREIQLQNLSLFMAEEKFHHPPREGFPLTGGLKDPKPSYKLGSMSKNADLIIGIPTVRRQSGDYLLKTIHSLLVNQSKHNADLKILIFIGETNESYIQERIRQIHVKFKDAVNRNLIHVISPPRNYYPRWELTIQQNLNDPIERVKWRSKQNLDQIFLMMYAYQHSPTYYLMLEDDVLARKGYVATMLEEAQMRERNDWFFISFCSLGAIGKLFKATTLPSYASFIHMFWNRKPLDWLQLDYAVTVYCSHDEDDRKCRIRRGQKMPVILPSLFQHVGKFSSLQGKIQDLKEKSFHQTKQEFEESHRKRRRRAYH